MTQPILFFIFDSPTQIIFVVAIIFLLFGSSKLPQLAKSIGQTQKAFKDGMREAEEEEQEEKFKQKNPVLLDSSVAAAPQISAMTDEEIMAEMRRRAEAKQQ